MFAVAGDELQEFNLQPVRADNTAMTPPKEGAQILLPWREEGVFPNERRLLHMIEEGRLGGFSKIISRVYYSSFPDSALGLQEHGCHYDGSHPSSPLCVSVARLYCWGKSIKSYLKCSLE